MRKNIETVEYILIITVLIVFVFWPITKTFYQQDEWLGYGLFLTKGIGTIMQSSGGWIGLLLGQGRVLNNTILYIFFKYSPLNVFHVSIFAIFVHILNVLLLFVIARTTFKKSIPAFLGSLFFALNSVSQSAVTWAAASVNTLPSTTFILAAVLLFFKYLEKINRKYLVYSFLLLYVSLFFKETGIFLFILFPAYAFFAKKMKFWEFLAHFWMFILSAGLIVAYRLIGLLITPHDVALFLTGSSKYFIDSILFRSVFYPITSFSLAIIPPETALTFSRYITNVYYPFIPESQFILVASTAVMDFLAAVLTGMLLLIFIKLSKITDRKTMQKVVFWILFLLGSFLPYVIISKGFSYLESRYYYIASASWGILFGWFFWLIFHKKSITFKAISVIVYGLFIYFHIATVNTDIKLLVRESEIRKSIITQIQNLVPNLNSEKNIFYVSGDNDYLLPGHNVPFQSGFGYLLMDLYFGSGKIPALLLENQYLFEIGSQGYKEVGDKGFGYFSDEKMLKPFLKSKGINIVRLYYESKTGRVNIINSATSNY